MHFSKIWPAGLTDGVSSLDAADMGNLDADHAKAVNGDDGGTWSPAAVVEIGGKGLQVDMLYEYVRVETLSSGYAWDSAGPDVVVACNIASGASGVVTLPQPVINRMVCVCDYGATFGVSGSKVTVGTYGPSDTIDGVTGSLTLATGGAAVTLVSVKTDTGSGGAWKILSKKSGRISQTFTVTASSAWTAPPGCTVVDLEMCGGGGSGAGGRTADTTAGNRYGGGPGGGGAPRLAIRVPVVPGTAYDVTVGTGGASVAAGAQGNDGNPSQFNPHGGSALAWAPGGGGALSPVGTPTGGLAAAPGGTIAQPAALRPTAPTYSGTVVIAPLGAGGFGTTGDGSDGFASTVGSTSLQATGTIAANNGGSPGTPGALSGTYHGGGAGAGGGGGPFGVGAAGGGGGAGNNSGAGGAGSTGTAATANTGAGGGGGGAGGAGSGSGGLGAASGAGGSGVIVVSFDSP